MINFEENLIKIKTKHSEIAKKLSGNVNKEEYVKLTKEFSDLNDIVPKIDEYFFALQELKNLEELLKDPALEEIASEEIKEVKHKIPELEHKIKIALLPKDEADEKNAIIELRAGTGGDEAALFCSNLFNMYQRYAERQNWKFEILSIADTGIGGFKEASALISGKSVFAKLKFESGVHRVQRIPSTESNGRIHTSAATVAVLPEAEEVDIKIEDKDVRIDTYRASGAGGQHVNTTDSAVRVTHIPTGVVVTQQDEKSQHKNKAKALKILRSRLYDLERQKKELERASSRKTQVGSGDRSERIRTYNFPQGRVSDHRVNITLYKITEVMNGDIQEFIDALITQDESNRLANL